MRIFGSIIILGVLGVLVTIQSSFAVEVDWPVGGGADTIFVSPLDTPVGVPSVGVRSGTSVRASITIDPIRITGDLGQAVLLPIELQVGMSVATQQYEITRAKASALRAKFAKVMPVNLLTYYRNLDRGIEWGADLIELRVPIVSLRNGDIVVLGGVELGVRHYSAPVDTTAVMASAVLEGRAVVDLIQNWLSLGFQGRVRYDLDSTVMSGLEESGMGYLSLLLDEDHQIHARVYGGIEHQSTREALGLPTVNAFGGLGVDGTWGR